MRGSYQNHPGFEAGDCPLRITVRPHYTGMSSRGFACSASGGHRRPRKECAEVIKELDREADELNEMLDNW